MKRRLLRSNSFVHAAKKYLKKNPSSKGDIQEALELLSADALQPQLKSHKLKGPFEGFWACSAGYDIRIIFRFVTWESTEAILLETIGTHEEVY